VSARAVWPWLRLAGGAALLGVVVWRVGTGPIVTGFERIDAVSVGFALLITAGTTLGSAWRWSVVARALGVGLSLRTAVTRYYRSQFLNVTLPGGVLGDLHRGVSHGREVDDLGRGLRAVAWERTVGQVVQVVIGAVVLVLVTSPVRSASLIALPVAAVLALLAALLTRSRARWVAVLRADFRTAVAPAQYWPQLVAASTLVVAGHTTIFVVAARTAGVHASVPTLLPLALLVLLAMGVPTSVGGWGPREGVAAWAFGAAGLGSAAGLATATVYGVVALLATTPGAVILLADVLRRPPRTDHIDTERRELCPSVPTPS
jgi:hypothetical protein